MEWRGRQGSRNVEDRRRMGSGGAGSIGLVGMLAVLAFGYFFGIDISPLVSETGQSPGQPRELTAEDRQMGDFAGVILRETETVFGEAVPAVTGRAYGEPQMVLYSGVTQSGCGGASAQMGPFYCPADQRIYLDTDFFKVMSQRMGAGGDLAAAYVIAHEVGHHVQNQLGILPKVTQMRQSASKEDSNYLSVLTELQADCFAGMWARSSTQDLRIDRDDLAEAINAAAAVGDDALMQSAGRAVVPDAFTHGSSADRQKWFLRGYEGGTLSSCNSFAEAGL
ncbi:MAG TPA: neutral zinc metallopeptidase [Paracoccus sp. (in: a-proteobacteria)]|uniref:KPN_02809 family neutral zinc metallopeptidase n=1 Tax=uncultured Paracoccus sp. TaxID=189685 RepID=UPI002632A06D|nr:neutral zinc metallopeptidase [uncultured Paracoccus sp.]HMQ40775.1 neutral zinc metallopeptidase [Paracoccus sp. (in: a-proteobacteria)]HMR37656.1 neutral zinc metallopeptidase [Paracoccus sp. (in: a-proteobacteria)]